MKNFFIILFLSFCCFVFSQEKIVSISPAINQQDEFNKGIIKTLGNFLETNDPKFWLKSDFKKYKSPYSEIFYIQAGRLGKDFYKPSLMEIISTENENKKIVKVAFIGYNPENKSNLIKAIYNVIANKTEEGILFSKYLDYATKDWKTVKEENITYYLSPLKNINKEEEVERQKKDLKKLSTFFETQDFPITYYSTNSPKETFEIKGFDYHPMMYVDKSVGFAQAYDIVISGNNSEYYTHEIVHLYTTRLFPKILPFLDEGIATYFGGSGKFDYSWQKEKLKKFLTENPDFDFFEHLNIYERIYFEQETPVPYIFAALICDRTIKLHGKEKLFSAFNSEKDLIEILKSIGLTKENINQELRKELGL